MEEKITENLARSTEEKTKKPLARKIAAIAGFSLAGLAVIALIGAVVITFISSNNKVMSAKVTAFKSEKQITSKLKDVIKQSNSLYTSDANYIKNAKDESASTDVNESTSSLEQNTNNYAAYVPTDDSNIADTVKTDGKYIYCLNSSNLGKISVFAAKGDNSNFVTEIKIANRDSENFAFRDFFLSEKTLIAVEQSSVSASTGNAGSLTRVEIFDISDIKNVNSEVIFTQSGSSRSSKLIDGVLYIASVHYAVNSADLPRAAVGENPNVIPTKDIYCVENPNEPNFMVISGINLEDSSAVTKAVMGSANDIFCGENNMYITAYEYNYGLIKKENNGGASYTHLPVNHTQIVKVDLKDSLDLSSSARVIGYTDNEYSFDEKDSKLRVTSTVTQDNERFTESANIFVLDEKLGCVGKLTDFANGESIQAVRYFDDTAYVISYKSDDPLFVVDLKKAAEPKVLSQKKLGDIPSMLVSADENTLLGIGYYTADESYDDSDGLKLVTYDISNKSNPNVSDTKVLKNYESPAQNSPRALLYNSERGDYTIPMIYENYNDTDSKYETKYGMLNFKVESGKINVTDDYTSSVFTSSDESSTSLDRCVYVDDYVYLIGSSYNYYSTDDRSLIEAVSYK